MASEMKQAMDALQTNMDTSLDGIKARMAALEQQSARTDMTPEEEADTRAKAAAFADQLAALVNPSAQ